GIYNRRKLGPTLETIYDTYKTLTVAIIDTDNFKLINDELGHFVGDDVLKAVAQLAKDVVKEYGGEVVRYGGDEFVVIFPLSLEESIQILEEFRNSVYYIQVTHEIEIPISVTIGVCSTSNLKLPPEDTVKVADNALLRGKSKGKNCIIVAEISDIS
ncbi:MAG: GGDEF domain-containing protein, partial [Cellulosilyticum sp.]|nr:GGDEF domain-containing protein [Cellulosilyticum sp.]